MVMSPPSELMRSVEHLQTTSAKIRALSGRGMARADIARLLGIRYQHVRNVLEQDRARGLAPKRSHPSAEASAAVESGEPTKVRLGPDGRMVVPASFRDALGLKEGDVLFARIEEGEIHLLTPKAAMHRVQSMVRQFVPEGARLADELIEDRRREVEREAK